MFQEETFLKHLSASPITEQMYPLFAYKKEMLDFYFIQKIKTLK